MTQLRQTIRRLGRSPGFTLTTVLTLAIGIGATTAIFSVINGILIQPLPYPDSDRLIALVHRAPGFGDGDLAASPAIYFTYRDNNTTFKSVALWFANTASITGAGNPEEVQALRATHEFLPTLGVQPALGRTFSASDDTPGNSPTVILSYGYWQRHFGGAESALGQALVIDGMPHTVIGVLPQQFRFLQQQAEILLPAQPVRALAFAGPIGEQGIARLRDGVTLAEASADVQRMVPIVYDSFPIVPGLTRAILDSHRFGPNLKFLKAHIVGDLDDVLWILMGTIGMLLMIACVNVANLQLVRTEGRGQELAICAALGAGWSTIARGLLLESMLLGLAGGAAGLMFALLGLPVLLSAAAGDLPGVLEVQIDATVLAFTLAVSLASGLLFGIIPIVRYAGPRVATALHGAARSYGASRQHHRLRNSLVVVQVALALVLLVASGLMIRTFQSLRQVDPGFTAPAHIQTVQIAIPRPTVPEFDRVIRMQNDIQDRLASIAGVDSVGFASRLPLTQTGPSGPFYFEDKPDAAPREIEFRYTSPNFFQTLGTPLLAGRSIEWADTYAKLPVVVVSNAFARRQWGSPAAALGKRMRRAPNVPWLEVVGVVGDIHHDGVDKPAPDTVYLTQGDFLAQYASRTVTFFVRSERIGTTGFIEDLQQAIWSVNRDLPLASVRTMGEIYERSMARTALTLMLLAITAAMALLLGLIGIYGVVSYVLARRTREIGIRMALGAPLVRLKRMLVQEVLLLAVAGAMLGLGGAAALSRLMETLLFGVTALDPVTYVAVSATVVIAAVLAGWLPARRVTRIDPMRALREE